MIKDVSLLFVQPVIYHFWGHYRLNEGICTRFWRLHHFDGFCQSFGWWLKCCYCFLCHGLYFSAFIKKTNYLISLWTVIRLRIGLNFLISILSGVFFLFLVVIYLEVPGIPDSLCSVHSKITWILFPFFAIVLYLKCFYNLLFGVDFLQDSRDSLLVDDLQSFWRNVQGYPTIFFLDIKLLFRNVRIEPSLGLIDRKGNVISKHHLFSCNFTNFRHLPNFWVILLRLQIYIFLIQMNKSLNCLFLYSINVNNNKQISIKYHSIWAFSYGIK